MFGQSCPPGLDGCVNAIREVLADNRCRLAHRLREMQKLPYVVVTNPHLSVVYELYYKAFESLRRVSEIKSVDENDEYCKIISANLKEHLAVIPNLVMGALECGNLVQAEAMESFLNAMLRAVSLLVMVWWKLPANEWLQAHLPPSDR